MKILLYIGIAGVAGFAIYKFVLSGPVAQAAANLTGPKPAIGPNTASGTLCKTLVTVGGALAAGSYGVPPSAGGAAGGLASGPLCKMGAELVKNADKIGSFSNTFSLGITGSLWDTGKTVGSDIAHGNIGAAGKDVAKSGVKLIGNVGKTAVSDAKKVASKLNPFHW